MRDREYLNVSGWNRPQKRAHEAAEEVREGEMPLWFYEPLHPKSWSTEAEKAELAAGLAATFGGGGDEEGDLGHGRDRGGDGR